jgi:hypothetical protein
MAAAVPASGSPDEAAPAARQRSAVSEGLAEGDLAAAAAARAERERREEKAGEEARLA